MVNPTRRAGTKDAPGFMPGTGSKNMKANMPACMGSREDRKMKSIENNWKF